MSLEHPWSGVWQKTENATLDLRREVQDRGVGLVASMHPEVRVGAIGWMKKRNP